MANGKPVVAPGRERLVMFQEAALFPWLDVLGNVLFGLKLKPNLRAKDRLDVAKYYLELVGLTPIRAFQHSRVIGRHETTRALWPARSLRTRGSC